MEITARATPATPAPPSDALATPAGIARAPGEAPPRVSVVIPCLNEAENIEECVTRAWTALREHGIAGEVVVADNGSSDGSAEIAAAAGARVVEERRRGYGSAYLVDFSMIAASRTSRAMGPA